MCGKPVIRGTRIPADLILRKISRGIPEREILADHPGLKLADIRAAVRFAADLVSLEESALLPAGR